MRKIRTDLVGAVMVGRSLFAAGQDVPDDVEIHQSLVEEAPKDPEANEGAEDDFSDLLADGEKPKSAPKSSGRKPAARKN